MFNNLQVFRTAQAMAVHAANRQSIVARNMANADTPGYQALDLKPFGELAAPGRADTLRVTRARHLNGPAQASDPRADMRAEVTGDPNGNGVSVELEMLKAVEIKRQHNQALAIYKSSLGILRTSIGRR